MNTDNTIEAGGSSQPRTPRSYQHSMNLHRLIVASLAKDGSQMVAEQTPQDCHLNHMMLGLAGEVGELVDAIKRNTIYRKPLDVINVIEELGDIEFYLEGVRNILCITRQATLDMNIAKLNVRYHAGSYNDTQAQARADKETNTEGTNHDLT
jgi:NTP pyrophosphatase (non-canonical NTP hydrolase)